MGVRAGSCAAGAGRDAAPAGRPRPGPGGLWPAGERGRGAGHRGRGVATRVWTGLACGAVALLAVLPPGGLRAAQGPLLADGHRKAGIECAGCHPETPPASRVATGACLGCHGTYPALAARTGTQEPNPHDSHLGEVACEKCHHAHKPSENLCGTCHDMDLRIP